MRIPTAPFRPSRFAASLLLAIPNTAFFLWWTTLDGWRSRWLLDLLDSPLWWLGLPLVTWSFLAPATALIAALVAARDLLDGRPWQAAGAIALSLVVGGAAT